MRISLLPGILLIVTLILFIRCNHNTLAAGEGGGATTTTNCQVFSSGGDPVQGALVRVVDADNWFEKICNEQSVVIDSTVTGSSGEFTVRYPSGMNCNLQIDAQQEALFIPSVKSHIESGSVNALSLKKKASLDGTLQYEELNPEQVNLYGTAYVSSVGSELFSFPAIAPGRYSLIAFTDLKENVYCGGFEIGDGENYRDTFKVSDTSVLIDDFDSGFMLGEVSKLGLMTGGVWYHYVDSGLTAGAYSRIRISTETGDALQGTSLTAICTLSSGVEYAYAGIGVLMGGSGIEYDFSAFNSIAFRAKGRGSVRLSVEAGAVTDLGGNLHFGKVIDLNETWTDISIPFETLELADPNGLTWDDVKRTVQRIEFEFSNNYNNTDDSLSLWLDDLYLNGSGINGLVETSARTSLQGP